MLAPILEEKKDEIAVFCKEHAVRSLWAIEDAAVGCRNDEAGEIGLLVEFEEYDETVVLRYLSLAGHLESLLDHTVVLASPGALRFRHVLREHLESTRILLYG